MNLISEDLKLAVKKGAHWMDENHAGWAEKIDLSRLSMGGCTTCIIGQAVCYYFDLINRIEGVSPGDFDGWAREHGFNGDGGTIEYRALETLWTDQVRERLG